MQYDVTLCANAGSHDHNSCDGNVKYTLIAAHAYQQHDRCAKT